MNPVFAAGKDSLIYRHEQYLNRYEQRWNKLLPRYQKIQFAGSMGLFSIGTGWSYCKERLETDVLFGFLPAYTDERAKLTFTVKENYIPWKIDFGESRWDIEPLTCGIYMNSILDRRFWRKEPDRYPSNYYKFSTRIRFHVFLGQRITFDLDKRKSIHKSISAFYELSTSDLYLISAVSNRYLHPRDYLSLSFGLKFQVF